MKFDKIFGKKTKGFDMNNTLSKNFGIGGMTNSKNFGIGGMTNQKGASQKMQSMWANMTTPQRATMRRNHIDSDGDGVPNKWDCRPFDKYRQDSDEEMQLINQIKGDWRQIKGDNNEIIMKNPKYGIIHLVRTKPFKDEYEVRYMNNSGDIVNYKEFNNFKDAESFFFLLMRKYK